MSFRICSDSCVGTLNINTFLGIVYFMNFIFYSFAIKYFIISVIKFADIYAFMESLNE